MTPINLAIICEQSIFRKILVPYLTRDGGIQVRYETAYLSSLINDMPDALEVLLVDVISIRLEGIGIMKALREKCPELKMLILCDPADLPFVVGLMDIGIHGCVSKNDEPHQLMDAISSVAGNRIYRSKIFTDALYYNKQRNLDNTIISEEDQARLNEREKRVLQCLWEEMSNKEIAQILFLGVRSIEKIRQDMKEKLNIRSTVGLIKYAIENHIIQLEYSADVPVNKPEIFSRTRSRI